MLHARPLRSLLPLAALALFGCGGGAQVDGSGEADATATRAQLAPQSSVEDAVTDRVPSIAFPFSGAKGDIVSPDVWPTGASKLQPKLTLLGPASSSGKRAVLASGQPRGSDAAHLAIDGFKLPRAGSYLVIVAQTAKGQGGDFTLRFWTSGSHAPRPESAQLDLSLQTTAAMQARLAVHASGGSRSGQPWTDAEVNAALDTVNNDLDVLSTLSDARDLLGALSDARSDQLATDAQLSAVQQTVAAMLGTPAEFGTLTRQEQAFALYWLGVLSTGVFDVKDVPASARGYAQSVSGQISALVASWPGAAEEPDQRHVRQLLIGSASYGYIADWACNQSDSAGRETFDWYSTDYFNASGGWLGENSAGASEPDDD
jgi:hypothetical protein